MYAAKSPNAPAPPLLAGWLVLAAIGLGALACVLLVLPYRSFDLDRFFAPKELALHTAALVAGLTSLAVTRRFALTRADLALIAWMLLSFISALFATNHWLAYRAFMISLSGAVVFWSARLLAEHGLGPAVARGLALVVVTGAVTALLQAYGVRLEFAALNRAPGGTFGNRNFMAHLAAAGVPLLIWCIASARSKAGAFFWAVCLAASAGALVLSRTRAAWLSLAVASAIALLIAMRGPALFEPRIKRRLTFAIIAIAQGVVLALFLPNKLDWKSDSPYLDSVKGVVDFREGSGAGRLAQYANSAKMAAAHPLLGVGPGNWPVIYPTFAPVNDPSIVETTGMTANPWPSSDWVAALSERGVPALLSLAAFVALLLGGAMRSRYDETLSADERLAAVAGAGVLLIAALEGGFDAVLLLPTPSIVVWGAAGALLAPRSEVRAVALPPARSLKVGSGFAAVMLIACVLGYRKIQAMRLYEVGTVAAVEQALVKDPGSYRIQMRAADLLLARGQCNKAHEHAQRAKSLFPNAPAPKHVLGQCRN